MLTRVLHVSQPCERGMASLRPGNKPCAICANDAHGTPRFAPDGGLECRSCPWNSQVRALLASCEICAHVRAVVPERNGAAQCD